jgi:acyl-CoA thioesterase
LPTPATPTIGPRWRSAPRSRFSRPPRAGDVLIAVGRERSRAGRTGIYDVEVSNGDGTLVALFRGTSSETRGEVVASKASDQG